MILSIIVILFVLLVAYLHYVQGLLSGLISAVLALLAAGIAMSNYEPMAEFLSGGKRNDQSQGYCLIGLFVLTYLVGRILFDRFVPGNVRLPFLADKIGGAACGLVAGMCGAGIIAIAIQSMPLGVSVAGHSRYELTDTPRSGVAIALSDGRSKVDRTIWDELKDGDKFGENANTLILPADDFVVGLVRHQSNGGALAGDTPLDAIHPDLLQELFGQRLGLEPGAKRTATNKLTEQVAVHKAYLLELTDGVIARHAAEVRSIRGKDEPPIYKPGPGNCLLAVGIMFKAPAADEGGLVRLAPAAVRMVLGEGETWKNHYPVGTLQWGKPPIPAAAAPAASGSATTAPTPPTTQPDVPRPELWVNRLDDYLFFDTQAGDNGAYFVFEIPKSALSPPANGQVTFASPGTFVEVKRTVKESLAQATVGAPPNDPKFIPLRKAELYQPPPAPPAVAANTPPKVDAPAVPVNPVTPVNPQDVKPTNVPTDTPAAVAAIAAAWSKSSLKQPRLRLGNELPTGINAGVADGPVFTEGAVGHLTAKQFDALEVVGTGDESKLSTLAKGDFVVDKLYVPDGKQMVQVLMTTTSVATKWDWAADPTVYTLMDAKSQAYKPNGAYAALIMEDGTRKVLANYKATGPVAKLNKVDKVNVTEVILFYLIPKDEKATQLRFMGNPAGVPLEP